MNRSILIVICDFLLVSLLAFSTVDINQVADEGVERRVKVDISTNQPDNRQDLTAVLRLALDDERKSRDRLMGQLTQTRDTLDKQQALLAERSRQINKQQALLTERDRQIQTSQQELQSREQETLLLQQEKAGLQQQSAAAATNIQTLQKQLSARTTDAMMSKEQVAATEAELRRQQEQAAALEQRLAQLAQSNQVILSEKQQLATQLQVAEAEKRVAAQQVARMQDEVQVVREEKVRLVAHADKLAEGVKTLAGQSGELAREIREHRPLAPNTLFHEFVTNRVQARFFASRAGIFGLEASKRQEAETVLVSDGTNTFALCHVEDTPLVFWSPGTEWESLIGTLGRNASLLPIPSVSFRWPDPRVVLIPLAPAQVQALGAKVYRITADPFKFQDALIVGAREGYYGECRFQIDLSTPQYVKMDRNLLKGLFGKFNPSRGDLVFSKTGELLGVMANSTYCLMLHKFDTVATIRFGQDVRAQHTGKILSRLYGQVTGLPLKLQ